MAEHVRKGVVWKATWEKGQLLENVNKVNFLDLDMGNCCLRDILLCKRTMKTRRRRRSNNSPHRDKTRVRARVCSFGDASTRSLVDIKKGEAEREQGFKQSTNQMAFRLRRCCFGPEEVES